MRSLFPTIRCVLALALAALALTSPVSAQLLYNEKRDKQAQEAQKLAAELQNGGVFQKALDNLDAVWKQQQGSVFRNAEDQMKARLAVLETWAQIDEYLEVLSGSIGPDSSNQLQKALAALKEQEALTRAALKELKDKVTAAVVTEKAIQQLGAWFEEIGKVDQIVDFAMKKVDASADQVAAAKEAQKQLKALAEEYKKFSLQLPASPGVIYLQGQIGVLKSREMRTQNLLAIEQRRQAETGAVRQLLAATKKGLGCLTSTERQSEKIATVLERRATSTSGGDAECLEALSMALMNFAALCARGETASRLAALRVSLEDRASALRLSAAGTRQIEELLMNGTARLALYHKGGMKPEVVAQFIQALSTAGIIPAIVLK